MAQLVVMAILLIFLPLLLTGSILAGTGGDTINVTGGSIATAITGNSGNDTFNISAGTIGSMTTGNGTNTINISGGTISGSITGGTGTNNYTISGGTISSGIIGTTGTENIVITGGTIAGLDLDQGSTSTITLSGGSITGPIVLDNVAPNTINLNGGSITGAFSGTGTNNFAVAGNFTTASTFANVNNLTINSGGNLVIENTFNPGGALVINSGGALTINSGTFTVTGTATNGGTMNINATTSTGAFTNNGALILNGNLTSSGAGLNNNNLGTLQVETNATLTGHYTSGGSSAKHQLTIADGSIKTLSVTGNVTIDGTIIVNSTGSTYIANGQTIGNLIEATGTLTDNGATIQDDSLTLDFTVADTGSNLQLSATRIPYSNFASGTNEVTIANIISSLTPTSGTDLANVFRALDTFTDINSLNSGLRQLAPDVNGAGSSLSSYDIQTASISLVENRVDLIARDNHLPDSSMNSLTHTYNLSTKSHVYKVANLLLNMPEHPTLSANFPSTSNAQYISRTQPGFWLKGIRNTGHQKEHGGGEGYKANTIGFTIGADQKFKDSFLLGTGLVLTHTNVDTNKISGTQISIYGSYSPDKYFMDGFLTLAYNKYKNNRVLNINDVNRIAQSKYNGYLPSIKIKAGFNYNHNVFKIIPHTSIHYSLLNQASYSEKGAGDVNLINVESKNIHKLEGGLGLQLIYNSYEDTSIFNFTLYSTAFYDFIGSRQIATSSFQGGGSSFVIQGFKPVKLSYVIGTGISSLFKDTLMFDVGYDIKKKNDFIGHTLSIKLKYYW